MLIISDYAIDWIMSCNVKENGEDIHEGQQWDIFSVSQGVIHTFAWIKTQETSLKLISSDSCTVCTNLLTYNQLFNVPWWTAADWCVSIVENQTSLS